MMTRFLFIVVGLLFAGRFDAGGLFAQDDPAQTAATSPDVWPPYPIDDYFRGEGDYFSLWKVLFCWGLFLCWVRTSDWISQDAQIMRTNWQTFNPIVVGSFAAAFLLVFVLPGFWLALLLMLAAYIGPLAMYIVQRNSHVDPHERVLTPDHLRFWASQKLRRFGVKIEAEPAPPKDKGPKVILTAKGAESDQENDANLLLSRQMPGYVGTRELFFDIVNHRAEAVLIGFGPEAAAVRYLIDGVWHDIQPQPREAADNVLAVMKTIAALKPEERQAKQFGVFTLGINDSEWACQITSQGTKTGERVLLKIEPFEPAFSSLDELGMRPKMADQLKELLAADHGFVLFSAFPGGGLTTTIHCLLSSLDRFLREFVSIEEENNREREVQNVDVATFCSAEGQTLATILPKLVRTQPNVLICRDLVDAETVGALAGQAKKDQLVISGIAAKDAAEAILRVLALKVPPAEFAAAISAVVHQRLIRKLCQSCKEAYDPPAELLKQLGIPQGKVPALYRAREDDEKICDACHGIGYLGRTAIFELLVVDDAIKKAIRETPKLDVLRQTARKAGMSTVRDHGVLLVAKGVTSVEELARVLKQ